ncbi:MAG: hypothetical protein AAF433_07405 [Bacteroidota bacterium]
MRVVVQILLFSFLASITDLNAQRQNAPQAVDLPKTEFFMGLRAGVFVPEFKDDLLGFDRLEFIAEPTYFPALQLGLARLIAPTIGLYLALETHLAFYGTRQYVNAYAISGRDYLERWVSTTLYQTYTNRQWRTGTKIGLAQQLGPFRIGLAYGMDFRLSSTTTARFESWRETLVADHPFLSNRNSLRDYPLLVGLVEDELLDAADLPEEQVEELLPLGRWTYWSWLLEWGRSRTTISAGGDYFWPINNPQYMRLGSRWFLGLNYYF